MTALGWWVQHPQNCEKVNERWLIIIRTCTGPKIFEPTNFSTVCLDRIPFDKFQHACWYVLAGYSLSQQMWTLGRQSIQAIYTQGNINKLLRWLENIYMQYATGDPWGPLMDVASYWLADCGNRVNIYGHISKAFWNCINNGLKWWPIIKHSHVMPANMNKVNK